MTKPNRHLHVRLPRVLSYRGLAIRVAFTGFCVIVIGIIRGSIVLVVLGALYMEVWNAAFWLDDRLRPKLARNESRINDGSALRRELDAYGPKRTTRPTVVPPAG